MKACMRMTETHKLKSQYILRSPLCHSRSHRGALLKDVSMMVISDNGHAGGVDGGAESDGGSLLD